MNVAEFPNDLIVIPVIERNGTIRCIEAMNDGSDLVVTPEDSIMLSHFVDTGGQLTVQQAQLASIILPNMPIIMERWRKTLH